MVNSVFRDPNSSLLRIFPNIFLKRTQLSAIPYQMIIIFPLPESTSPPQSLIAEEGRTALDSLHHPFQIEPLNQVDQQMDVVRHQDEIAEMIVSAIVLQQLLPNDVQAWIATQVTGSQSLVEVMIQFSVEQLMKFRALFRGQLCLEGGEPIRRIGMVVDVPCSQPKSFLVIPLCDHAFGKGIGETKGDEVGRAVLAPVWEISSVDDHRFALMVRFKWGTAGHWVGMVRFAG